uniref:Phosphatase n=1 Tax=viral metagenome TaxID=1070528 RepID=A0A6M3J8S9_9ZZZZ
MKVFVLDVDGVMTDGRMYYTSEGKMMKAFGADDHDALTILREYILIKFVTADKIGFKITHKRIFEDMMFPLSLVKMKDRVDWMSQWDLREVIYMGDGILDPPVFEKVGYSICPADGFYLAKEKASFVTESGGGHRAVAEACVHIKEKFFV